MDEKKRKTLLTFRLKGDKADEGRITIDKLTQALQKVQLCVKRLGEVLMGEGEAIGPGRIKGDVAEACTLEVVAINKGSFEVFLDLPLTEHQLLLFNKPLGRIAIEKMLDGIEALGQNKAIPSEFNYPVLTSLRDVGRVLDHGVKLVEFQYNAEKKTRLVVLNAQVKKHVSENISGPIKSPIRTEGVLREINLEKNTCQIFTPPRFKHYIQCTFSEDREATIKEALDTYVKIIGTATIREADGKVKLMEIKDIDDTGLTIEEVMARKMTAKDLLESGIPGMWKDRDIKDSTAFAQEHRKKLEQRKTE